MKHPKSWVVVGILACLTMTLPSIVGPFFAQRQGGELGEVATCMCCIPQFTTVGPWWAWLLVFVIFLAVGILMVYLDERRNKRIMRGRAEEEARRVLAAQEKRDDDIERYGDWIGRRLRIDANGYVEAVVTKQDGDKMTLSYLDDDGRPQTKELTIDELKFQ